MSIETIVLTEDEHKALTCSLNFGQYPWNGRQTAEIEPDEIEEYVLDAHRAFFLGAPKRLLRALVRMRAEGDPPGALMIRNLPLDPLSYSPPTGRRRDYVKPSTRAENALVGIGACLGEPFGSVEEKEGNLLHDVIPVEGTTRPETNEGAGVFGLHVEKASFDTRNDFLGLLCQRPDREGQAATPIADGRDALRLLDEETVTDLRRPEYTFRGPYSLDPTGERGRSRPQPVLSGMERCPELHVTFWTDGSRGTTPRAERALSKLFEALHSVACHVRLAAGDCVVLNNRLVVHGRTGFEARHDGQDRHLLRLYAFRSLWPVREAVAHGPRIVRRLMTS